MNFTNKPSLYAGFSWQIHAAALKATQAFINKLQEGSAESANLPEDQAAFVACLVPGMPKHSSCSCGKLPRISTSI